MLFVLLVAHPLTLGIDNVTSSEDEYLENLAFYCYNGYDSDKLEYYKELLHNKPIYEETVESERVILPIESPLDTVSGGPMDSPWPMKCHDTHHTGRSQYSTADNPYDELWKLKSEIPIDGGPVIDNNGIIYCKGSNIDDNQRCIIAVYPNGTLKWCFQTNGLIWSTPAIDEDGTIYIGTWENKLYAINPDGTEKWNCGCGDTITTSPAIGSDGTIYVGTMGKNEIVAVTPNGTVKWKYKTGYYITGGPAIGDDGTVYIGSGDNYFYAINPNGTLKWRYKTGYHIKGTPSIAEDDTVYIGSWDDYLYAFYPDGTLKWKSKIGQGTETNPSIASDGTIYVGSYDGHLYATYPNGTRRWKFKVISGCDIHQSSPAISADGTIYFGTDSTDGDKGYIYAVNPDGTERWRKKIANDWVESSPCIGEDGTVYIGSSSRTSGGDSYGYLYAFNRADLSADADGPHYGLIDESVQFIGTGYGGYKPYTYHWDFGDGETSSEQNPTHTYTTPNNYTVTLTVTDNTSNTSKDSTFAWIQDGNDPPEIPSIDGPVNGNTETKYDYTFQSSDPEGLHIWYYIEWGDGKDTGWIGPYDSDDDIVKSHRWSEKGTYIIRCKIKDPYNDESEWGELKVTMPKSKQFSNNLFLRFLEKHPQLFPILKQLLGLQLDI